MDKKSLKLVPFPKYCLLMLSSFFIFSNIYGEGIENITIDSPWTEAIDLHEDLLYNKNGIAHGTYLFSGQILLSGFGQSGLFTPSTSATSSDSGTIIFNSDDESNNLLIFNHEHLEHMPKDEHGNHLKNQLMFCAGHTLTSDGDLFYSGGYTHSTHLSNKHHLFNVQEEKLKPREEMAGHGVKYRLMNTTFDCVESSTRCTGEYSASTPTVSNLGDHSNSRYYPTVSRLPNGEMLTVGSATIGVMIDYPEDRHYVKQEVGHNKSIEVYNMESQHSKVLSSHKQSPNSIMPTSRGYPHVFVLPKSVKRNVNVPLNSMGSENKIVKTGDIVINQQLTHVVIIGAEGKPETLEIDQTNNAVWVNKGNSPTRPNVGGETCGGRNWYTEEDIDALELSEGEKEFLKLEIQDKVTEEYIDTLGLNQGEKDDLISAVQNNEFMEAYIDTLELNQDEKNDLISKIQNNQVTEEYIDTLGLNQGEKDDLISAVQNNEFMEAYIDTLEFSDDDKASLKKIIDKSKLGNRDKGFHNYGATSLMLPLRQTDGDWGYSNGSILVLGGGNMNGQDFPCLKRANVYDPYTKAWTNYEMQTGRHHGSASILPDGRIAILNGHKMVTGSCSPGSNAVDCVSIVDAGQNTTHRKLEYLNFRDFHDNNGTPTSEFSQGESEETRGYHATVILLPDGRLFVASGRHLTIADATEDGHYQYFYPDYMFEERITLSNITVSGNSISDIPRNQDFDVEFSDEWAGEEVTEAVLIGLSSYTHAFDMNQRYVQIKLVQHDQNNNTVTLNVNRDQYYISDGYYMLFLLNESNIPSFGKVVKLEN